MFVRGEHTSSHAHRFGSILTQQVDNSLLLSQLLFKTAGVQTLKACSMVWWCTLILVSSREAILVSWWSGPLAGYDISSQS